MSKTILITGASSGFGRDTAETLFRAGHTVYASMRRAEGKNREAAEALRKLGVKTVAAVLERDYGVRLSYEREVEFGRTIQAIGDATGREVTSSEIWEAFCAAYPECRGERSRNQ